MKGLKQLLLARTKLILSFCLFAQVTKRRPEDFTRNRLFPFERTIFFVLNSKKKSIQLEVDEFAAAVLPAGATAGKDGMVKARQKVGYEAFETLFRATIDVAMEEDALPYHKGYRLYAIDGSQLMLPSTGDIPDHFGEVIKGLTHCTAHMSCLSELNTGYLVDALLDSYHRGERDFAEEHLKTLASFGGKKDVILADRGYPSGKLIHNTMQRGQYILMRIPRNFNAQIDAQSELETTKDLIIDGYAITARIIKLSLSSGETETLLTNLPTEDFAYDDLGALYAKRWGIETEYDRLKNAFQLENFTGKTYLTIMQDFFATCYMTNMVASIAAEAQEELTEVEKDHNYKQEHKVNVHILIGRFKREFIQIVLLGDLMETNRRLDALVQQATRSYCSGSTKPPPPRNRKETHHKKSLPRKRAF